MYVNDIVFTIVPLPGDPCKEYTQLKREWLWRRRWQNQSQQEGGGEWPFGEEEGGGGGRERHLGGGERGRGGGGGREIQFGGDGEMERGRESDMEIAERRLRFRAREREFVSDEGRVWREGRVLMYGEMIVGGKIVNCNGGQVGIGRGGAMGIDVDIERKCREGLRVGGREIQRGGGLRIGGIRGLRLGRKKIEGGGGLARGGKINREEAEKERRRRDWKREEEEEEKFVLCPEVEMIDTEEEEGEEG